MGNKTDEEFAYYELCKQLKKGNLNGLLGLDCIQTLLASKDPITLDMARERLDQEIDKAEEKGVMPHSDIAQAKVVRLKFKDCFEAVMA